MRVVVTATFDTVSDLDNFVNLTRANATDGSGLSGGGVSVFQTRFSREVVTAVRQATGETALLTSLDTTVITRTADTQPPTTTTTENGTTSTSVVGGTINAEAPTTTTAPPSESGITTTVYYIVGGITGGLVVVVVIVVIVATRCKKGDRNDHKIAPENTVKVLVAPRVNHVTSNNKVIRNVRKIKSTEMF